MSSQGQGPGWEEEARQAGWTRGEDDLTGAMPPQPPPVPAPLPPAWVQEAQAAGWAPRPPATPAAGQSYSPPAAPPPQERRRPSPTVIAGAAAAALLVIVGGLAAILVSSDSGTAPKVQPLPTTLSAAVTKAKTVTTVTVKSKGSGNSSSAGSSSSASGSSSRSTSSATGLVPYRSGTLSAQRPLGWITEADGASHSGYTESKWRNPSDSNTSVLVDWTPGVSDSPQQSAEDVRAQTSRSAGYREISFSPTSLNGQPAEQWVFQVNGDQRVDYFVNVCGTGYAVLGSTSPGTYARYNGLFRSVARSVATMNAGC